MKSGHLSRYDGHCVDTCPLFSGFPSHLGHRRAVSRLPCAIEYVLIRYLRTCSLNGVFIPRGWRRGYEGETTFPSKRNRSIYPAMNFTALEIVHFFLTLHSTQYKRYNLKKGVMERGTEIHSRERHKSESSLLSHPSFNPTK